MARKGPPARPAPELKPPTAQGVSYDWGVHQRSHPGLVLLLVFALACGDDSAPPVDAGSDASVDAGRDAARPDAGTDAGTDAGPLPSTMLCGREAGLPYPAPDAWGGNDGPGGPQRTFTEDELFVNCAFLSGHETDRQHHNLLTMYDGYLLMPWAPEEGRGGLTFWDITDPCAPIERGVGLSEHMRETHALGFSHLDGSYAVVNHISGLFADGGVEFWDVSDTSAPTVVGELDFPGFFYPDSYTRVGLSVFWQVPYVYVGGAQNGVWIGDATDPRAARYVDTVSFEPTMQVGQVQAIGNLLVVTAAEGARVVLLDISDPLAPMPIGGGDFLAHDGEGEVREAYFTNVANGLLFFARKDGGAGIIVYDIRDPSRPTFAGDLPMPGGGGYVFVKDDLAFEGAGDSAGGYVFDISDLSNIEVVGNVSLEGDLDTVTPIGNVAILSVDAGANDGQGSAVAPYALEPDTTPPFVTWAWPPPDAVVAPTSRFGVTFNEFVDPKSAFEGSVRLYRTGEPETGRIPGTVSAQESIVNFHPFCALEPGSYTLEVMAGGIVDFNGNPVVLPYAQTITVE